MGQDKTHRDLFLGSDGIERLERLAQGKGASQSEIARQALVAYEVNQSLFRDTICAAVLALYRACTPDGLYDPAEDTRQEDAVRRLGTLLGSMYAAEGIQLALIRVITQQGETMTTTYRETSAEPDTFFVDEITDADEVSVIQEIGGTVEDAPDAPRMDGHVGRTRITLPTGCTYAGQTAGASNPQIITLPGGRQLMLSRRGAYEMILQFRGGDSSDSSKWNGAVRIPDTDEEE
jgi:hypothetical protein